MYIEKVLVVEKYSIVVVSRVKGTFRACAVEHLLRPRGDQSSKGQVAKGRVAFIEKLLSYVPTGQAEINSHCLK